jgi:Tfp pilus assembly protein FimT
VNWKKLPIIRTVGIVLLAVLAALAGAKVGRSRIRAEKAENRAQKLLADGSEKALKKAEALTKRAEDHKKTAEALASAAEIKIDNIGKADEDMAAITSRWNADRLQ